MLDSHKSSQDFNRAYLAIPFLAHCVKIQAWKSAMPELVQQGHAVNDVWSLTWGRKISNSVCVPFGFRAQGSRLRAEFRLEYLYHAMPNAAPMLYKSLDSRTTLGLIYLLPY